MCKFLKSAFYVCYVLFIKIFIYKTWASLRENLPSGFANTAQFFKHEKNLAFGQAKIVPLTSYE